MSKRWLIVITSLLFSFQFAAASATKIGYIDMEKAIQSTSAGKKAKSRLEKEFKKKKEEIKKKEKDLVKMREDLEKKKLVLSDDMKQKKMAALQKEILSYREMVGKSQVEIQKKERDLTVPILKKLKGIISDVAKKDGYSYILEKKENSVLWAKKEFDLTDKVVKLYEKKK